MTASDFREKWTETETPAQRLRWARRYWQIRAGSINASASQAAQSLNIKPGTYAAYEREEGSSKHLKLSHQTAIPIARRFQVDWTWLLTGNGTPFDNQLPPLQARVVELLSSASEDDQNRLAAIVEAFFVNRKAG